MLLCFLVGGGTELGLVGRGLACKYRLDVKRKHRRRKESHSSPMYFMHFMHFASSKALTPHCHISNQNVRLAGVPFILPDKLLKIEINVQLDIH